MKQVKTAGVIPPKKMIAPAFGYITQWTNGKSMKKDESRHEQPRSKSMSEALRLAEYLEYIPDQINRKAAAELRHLWAENEGLWKERGQLLDALRLADAMLSGANMNAKVVERKVQAALAKAEGKV